MTVEIPGGLAQALRESASLVVLTGAGVSAESGIPTFRDALTGLWARYNPLELATPEAFERDPETVSRWYDARRETCAAARPNPAHRAIARMQRLFEDRGLTFTLLTQNVDRLHQAAGSAGVVELHGSLWVWRCTRCGQEREERQVPFGEYPPKCTCGAARRPGVVWFNEALPDAEVARAQDASEHADLFLSVGTSALVYPAAGLPYVARSRGARIGEINAEPTPLTPHVDWFLRGKCGELLPALVSRAFEGPGAGP